MIFIKKAKLTAVGYLEVDYDRSVMVDGKSIKIEVSEKPKWDPHSDLLNRFAGLRIHLVRLCEQVKDLPESEGDLNQLLSDYKVTGFVVGGSDEHEGVTLIGRKALKGNRVLNLVSPFTKWEDEHNPYSGSLDLSSKVADAAAEVKEYLAGKKAPSLQLEMELGTENK